jgi:two-component system chemotaxis response regulator CheY
MRFLIVDDPSTMRRIIINMLNKLGHQDVAEEGNGKEGLDRVSAGPVDVIITDRNRQEMSGIDFIRTVRSMPEINDTPVLMVTTNSRNRHFVHRRAHCSYPRCVQGDGLPGVGSLPAGRELRGARTLHGLP